MNDKEILAEFKPKESTLGELAYAMKNNLCSKNGYANIFYIRDKEDALWVVFCRWYSGSATWNVDAGPVTDSSWWRGGCLVFSADFGNSDTPEPKKDESLILCECERCERCGKLIK